jgi:hypothetical protein
VTCCAMCTLTFCQKNFNISLRFYELQIPTAVLCVILYSFYTRNKITFASLESSGLYMYRQWSLYVQPVVTICTASGHYMYSQWSLYVPHSGHCMYRQWSLYIQPVVTLITASGHYMYRQWSLYVPQIVHYMYRQRSLYVPHSGHYIYRKVVTICTTSLTSNNSTFCPHSVFMCFVWISEQTDIISQYNIN